MTNSTSNGIPREHDLKPQVIFPAPAAGRAGPTRLEALLNPGFYRGEVALHYAAGFPGHPRVRFLEMGK